MAGWVKAKEFTFKFLLDDLMMYEEDGTLELKEEDLDDTFEEIEEVEADRERL